MDGERLQSLKSHEDFPRGAQRAPFRKAFFHHRDRAQTEKKKQRGREDEKPFPVLTDPDPLVQLEIPPLYIF
jgi:hypothetical protein